MDSKTIGLCPKGFEPPSCRLSWLGQVSQAQAIGTAGREYLRFVGVPRDCAHAGAFGFRVFLGRPTPSPPNKSLGFRGFDSSRLLILKGGNSHVRIIL